MLTIISNFGLLINDPYIMIILLVFCVLFKDTLADMFISAFSFTKSFICVVFKFAILFTSVMVYIFAMAFGQTFLHFTDKLFAVLFMMLLIVLLDTIVSFGKKVMFMLFGSRSSEKASGKVRVCNESRQSAYIPVMCERVFRLIQLASYSPVRV